jgi:hypothetical protein
VTVADVRLRWGTLVVAAAAAATAVALLALSRSYTFYFDEWDFILAAPAWDWSSYLQPHNEHPALIHRLIYALLLNTAGLRTYVPYMAVLAVLHGLNAVLLFELVRRRAGDLVALGAAMLLLVLGAGWENLLWAFQIGFVGSVTCGLGALLTLQRRGRVALAATVALTAASLMFSGIGAFFALAVAAFLALTPERRRDLIWPALLAIVLAAWYLVYGRFGAATNPPPTLGTIATVPVYTLWGLGEAAAGVIGEGGWWGPPALVAAVALLAWSWWRRRPDALALGVGAALVAFYAVTGLIRVQLGYEQAGAGRYVYEGAVLWMILLAEAARGLPWRGTWRPALAACLFLACFNSTALLIEFASAKTLQMARAGADLQALDHARGDPCLNRDARVDAFVMPQVSSPYMYYRAVDRYGDPAPPLPVTDRADYAQALTNLERTGCR